LVAAELEARWNEALSRVAALESRCAETRSALDEFSAEEQERLLELGADLRELWNHPQAPMALKKRILRTVLEEIIIDIQDEDPPKVHLRLHWAGGSHTELVVLKNRSGQHRRCATQDVVELVRELAKVCGDGDVIDSRPAGRRPESDVPNLLRGASGSLGETGVRGGDLVTW
jgi:hypothetical protein